MYTPRKQRACKVCLSTFKKGEPGDAQSGQLDVGISLGKSISSCGIPFTSCPCLTVSTPLKLVWKLRLEDLFPSPVGAEIVGKCKTTQRTKCNVSVPIQRLCRMVHIICLLELLVFSYC